jgi:folate-dependent phosphoribosylglycinamide formyltransferase PurN
MLCGPGFSSRVVYNALRQRGSIERVIMEEKPALTQTLRRKLKKLGWWRTTGQLLFLLYSKCLGWVSRKRRQSLITGQGLDDSEISPVNLRRVTSVNSEEVVRALKDINPDAVIINGTRIISAEVLAAVDAPFLNTHMGITPRYRGVHGGYWALANNDPEHCGVTVHLVDSGIDTGGVLYQAVIEVQPQDNYTTYPVIQLAAALPLLRRALDDIAANGPQVTEGPGPSQLWYHPTLWQYLRNRWNGIR